MKTNNKGFSLVELIVVIAIMAILAAVAIPTFAGFINKANVAADNDFMANLEYAIELANAADPTFELAEYSVVVDEDGNIDSITYTEVDAATPVTVAKGSDNEIIAAVASVIDWDYQFKATKDDTVTVKVAVDDEAQD